MRLCQMLALLALLWGALVDAETVLVTGATGRTGKLVYRELQSMNFTTRALVRNQTKARNVLGCGECDEAQGIFVGDVTHAPASLAAAMSNVSTLVIAVGATPTCGPKAPADCVFPKGGYPVDVDFKGTQNQVAAALAAGVQHVVLLSSMGSTIPDGMLDQLGHGWLLYYKLNAEAFLMSTRIPMFTIVKPGGLTDGSGGQHQLFVGHEDQIPGTSSHEVTRADVATCLAQAVRLPNLASHTRFDLVADTSKPASGDWAELFAQARRVVT